ncbi:hypothetical protein [Cupriavidus agavae]|uniref:Uncharacterized protein n=1 Tax=Cupriavidus agavae TaxID=1001822 RepID=A0A4Q7R868_9BURK|nr:hypothetical protein [Cupriavidus agavae]RZT29043.1 hypothetical protein EV147_5140 [Cupriavidus agavae]
MRPPPRPSSWDLHRRTAWRPATLAALAATLGLLGGCTSVLTEGTVAGAGIAGGVIAGAVTDDAAVATGIGLGVQGAARAALQYSQRRVHATAQTAIASSAGPLDVGAVTAWEVRHPVPIEPDEQGRVTVSRLVGGPDLRCKEIVFSVVSEKAPEAFYVAMICQTAQGWRWASAEPATERWGALQ